MRACAGGHVDLALLLYKQNPRALRIQNFYGETCLDLAGKSTGRQLVEALESMERDEGGSTGFSFGANFKSPAKKPASEFAKPAAITFRFATKNVHKKHK
jgi:hypothetical protein